LGGLIGAAVRQALLAARQIRSRRACCAANPVWSAPAAPAT